jgi:hypothetical protein
MAANTTGSLLLGGGPTANLQLPFVGTCVLTGTIPAGWTVTVTTYSTLSASPGSGNAGTLAYDTGDATFLDPGTFTNTGTFVDDSPGLTQRIAVGDFINTGTVVSNSPDFGFVSSPTSQPSVPTATFLDHGSVRVSHGAAFSSGGAANTTFILPPGGTIAATGTFNIANLSAFDMNGGSVTAGSLRTSQFLGLGAPTFNFAAQVPAGSSGTLNDTNGGALHGVIPRHWRVEVTGGSLTATPGSGNAGTLEYDTNNSTLLDPGTFTNAGTLVDDSTGFSQQIAVADFVNTGTVVANGPGLGFAATPTSQPAVPAATFLNQGNVRVSHGGVFSSGGAASTTFILAPGGTIATTGTFNIANLSTFVMGGGSVTAGMLRTSQFLGAAAPTFKFGAHLPATSSGALDDTNGGTLEGVIPRHWTFELTGGSLTATPSSGNAGVFALDYTGYPMRDPGVFTNAGTFMDAEPVSVGDLVNQAHAALLVKEGVSFAASSSISNAGQLVLAAGAALSVGGPYMQESTGTLQVTVAGTAPTTYGHLAVKGRALLGGVLSIVKGPSYAAKQGDTQQIITAASIARRFSLLHVAAAGPGLVFKVATSATALTLTVTG